MLNDCPVCHKGDMMFAEVIEYGADADGRRGVPMTVFRCSECGHEELWEGNVQAATGRMTRVAEKEGIDEVHSLRSPRRRAPLPRLPGRGGRAGAGDGRGAAAKDEGEGKMVRNAKDDLALCDKATPGPWKYDGMHNEIQTPRGETYWLIVSECRSAPDQGYPDDPQYDANFDFIAMAREALPYWIKRAVAAEKEIDELLELELVEWWEKRDKATKKKYNALALSMKHETARAEFAEAKVAELFADLQERDQALHVESEALGCADDRAERLEQALERACKFVEDVTGNCPLVLDRDFDFDYCEEHCINDFAGCWKKYFLGGDK